MRVLIVTEENADSFEDIQKDYDCLYSTSPHYIINKKLKIPYFYNIYAKELIEELNFNLFNNFYSKIQGATAIFVNDKKLNKYSEWLDLNSYWVPNCFDEKNYFFIFRKFFTPKLNIGIFLEDDSDLYSILDKIIFAKKANWVFHIFNNTLKNEDIVEIKDKKDVYNNCHIFLNLSKSHCFPDKNCLEAMSSGCVVLSPNYHGNNTHIIFDDIHYYRLDFLDTNVILDALRFCDKRREKLERISKKGSLVANKYFNSKSTKFEKLNIMHHFIK